ncbi:MAG: hypothetical protein WC382_08180 [Methanoregulaceae archaeon]
MDPMLVFSLILMLFLVLNTILLVMRFRAAPDKPMGKGIGLALGLAIGLTLWVPLTVLTGDQATGIMIGSGIGMFLAIGLESYSARIRRRAG